MLTVRAAAAPARLTGQLLVLRLASSGASRKLSGERAPHGSRALPW